MRKKFKVIFIAGFIALFAVIEVLHYFNNYSLKQLPPSAAWAKKVLVSKGDLYTSPKLAEINSGYVVAQDDDKYIRVILLNTHGKKLMEKKFEIGGTTAKDINLLSDGSNILVNWGTSSDDISHNIRLDSKLNEIAKWNDSGVSSCSQIDGNALLTAYKDRIGYYNLKTGRRIFTDVDSPAMVAGADTSRGYIVTFIDKKEKCRYFFIKDDVQGPIMDSGITGSNQSIDYSSYAVAGSSTSCTILRQYKGRASSESQPPIERVTFSFDGNKRSSENIYLNDANNIQNIVSANIKDESRFLASAERRNIRTDETDIIDLIIQEDGSSKVNFVSGTPETSLYSSRASDAAIFADYISDHHFNIYMTSQKDDFKNIANVPAEGEKKSAFFETLDWCLKSVPMSFLLCLWWSLLGIFIIGILCVVSLALSEKMKRMIFIIVCALTAALKAKFIYSKIYVRTISILPWYLKSSTSGMLIMLAISALCFVFGYLSLIQENEKLPIIDFTIAVFIDAVLSIAIFYPFMI